MVRLVRDRPGEDWRIADMLFPFAVKNGHAFPA